MTERAFELRIGSEDQARLLAHLFPGDGEEHGAVIAAGLVRTSRGLRVLVRRVFLARDGEEFERQSGYRLSSLFVARTAEWCREHGCAWLSVHNHGPGDRVRFSSYDRSSHERLYPTLLDLVRRPVGALVFASAATDGELWLGGGRLPLRRLVSVGARIENFYPEPPPPAPQVARVWDRQALMLGARGQQLLAEAKVGVIGAGGAGALVLELLGKLGVGELVAIDPKRIDVTNLSRIPGATRLDALAFLAERSSRWAPRIAERYSRPKVSIARRVARRANPKVRFRAVHGDVRTARALNELRGCDFIFCATDTMSSRLLFNALCHQYLIPGIQLGAKVQVSDSGAIAGMHLPVRPVGPDGGCLDCAGVISQRILHEESTRPEHRAGQRYVDDDAVHEASVISLNAIAASHGVTDFLFALTGLHTEPTRAGRHQLFEPRERSVGNVNPTRDADCVYCGRGPLSGYAVGDAQTLPLAR
jgi:molybdopterin/thiamine biosynthesis adenylyltransferase